MKKYLDVVDVRAAVLVRGEDAVKVEAVLARVVGLAVVLGLVAVGPIVVVAVLVAGRVAVIRICRTLERKMNEIY